MALRALTLNSFHHHMLVLDDTLFNDDIIIQHNCAVAHRNVVVSLGIASFAGIISCARIIPSCFGHLFIIRTIFASILGKFLVDFQLFKHLVLD